METLFNNLDRWRHFAGYPLEPRVDALFGLFLPKVIEDCCEVEEMHPQVIPQFPLKKSDNNQSDKVDFFAMSKDGKQAFLIELKTDMGSPREEQDEYLIRAKERGMARILSDFKEIAKASDSRKKYFHLMNALSEMELLRLPNELEEKIRNVVTRDSTNLISEIEVLPSAEPKIEVIFIQPKNNPKKDTRTEQGDFRYIYFDEIADSIQRYGELGRLFARYLRRWKTKPGKYPPKKT